VKGVNALRKKVRKGTEERYREYVHCKSEGGSVFIAGVNLDVWRR
jgi:hypothetical protein